MVKYSSRMLLFSGILLAGMLLLSGCTSKSKLETENKEIKIIPIVTSENVVENSEIPEISTEEISSEFVETDSFPNRTVSEDANEYFSRSVFVGDSIILGYRNYLEAFEGSPVTNAIFLSTASYSAAHALNEEDDLHPIFRGKKQPIWQNLAELDVDRVFLMFGTNDLIVKDAVHASGDVLALVDKIHETNPDIEVHIISMTPVYEGVSKGALNNETIDWYNLYLQQGAQLHEAYYVDINTALRDENGNIQDQYSCDNYVHETNKAYTEVWDAILTNYALGIEPNPATEEDNVAESQTETETDAE